MKEYISPDADVDIPAWVAFCGQLAPFSSILMFLSPIPTIRNVLRTGTVGDLPLLPYTSMVTSCFVWILYGALKREPMIWGTNIVEFILSVYYFVEFTNYAPKSSPTFPGSVWAHIKLCIGTWGVSLWIAIFFSTRVSTIGDLTVLLTILTFASPLAAVKAVLESQSSESIPWPFTLAALFNCCLWTIVGVWEMHDIYVYFPAVLGLVFAGLQVALKLYFGDHPGDNPSYMRAPTAPVEMPYPVLESLRQVVMIGNNYASPTHDRMTMDLHDLQLDLHGGTSNTDYVELGVPLTGDGSSPSSSASSQQQFHHQQHHQHHVVSPPGSLGAPTSITSDVNHFGGGGGSFGGGGSVGGGGMGGHHKHSKSNDGLESIIFTEESSAALPFPTPLTESFRSRSGSIPQTGSGGQQLQQPQQQQQQQHGHSY